MRFGRRKRQCEIGQPIAAARPRASLRSSTRRSAWAPHVGAPRDRADIAFQAIAPRCTFARSRCATISRLRQRTTWIDPPRPYLGRAHPPNN